MIVWLFNIGYFYLFLYELKPVGFINLFSCVFFFSLCLILLICKINQVQIILIYNLLKDNIKYDHKYNKITKFYKRTKQSSSIYTIIQYFITVLNQTQ